MQEHCPAARVLELYLLYGGKALENADAWLEMPTGTPEELLDAVNSLALRKKQ